MSNDQFRQLLTRFDGLDKRVQKLERLVWFCSGAIALFTIGLTQTVFKIG